MIILKIITGNNNKINNNKNGDDAFALSTTMMKPFPHRNLDYKKRIFKLQTFACQKGYRECIWYYGQQVQIIVNYHQLTT